MGKAASCIPIRCLSTLLIDHREDILFEIHSIIGKSEIAIWSEVSSKYEQNLLESEIRELTVNELECINNAKKMAK